MQHPSSRLSDRRRCFWRTLSRSSLSARISGTECSCMAVGRWCSRGRPWLWLQYRDRVQQDYCMAISGCRCRIDPVQRRGRVQSECEDGCEYCAVLCRVNVVVKCCLNEGETSVRMLTLNDEVGMKGRKGERVPAVLLLLARLLVANAACMLPYQRVLQLSSETGIGESKREGKCTRPKHEESIHSMQSSIYIQSTYNLESRTLHLRRRNSVACSIVDA